MTSNSDVSGALSATYWRKCTTCKKSISFQQKYWVCNVSTCNRKRTGLVFCSVSCWDAHVPVMNHRDAWALEKTAPKKEEWMREMAPHPGGGQGSAPQNLSVSPPVPDVFNKGKDVFGSSEKKAASPSSSDDEILVVVSKVKDYIKRRWDMNTAASVMPVLSDYIRRYSLEMVARAEKDGRKTVMDRDLD